MYASVCFNLFNLRVKSGILADWDILSAYTENHAIDCHEANNWQVNSQTFFSCHACCCQYPLDALTIKFWNYSFNAIPVLFAFSF